MVKAAKKRKAEEDEPFALPKFDEVAYMTKEIRAAEASFVLLALAVLLAILLYALTVAGIAAVAFLVGLVVTFLLPRVFKFLRFLPWPKLDVSGFERKDWLGHGGTFFFSWLAFWILILNLPFTDITNPTIAAVTVNGFPVRAGGDQNPINVSETAPVLLTATIFDNDRIARAELVLDNGTGPQGFSLFPSGAFRWTLGLVPGDVFDDAVIVATDPAGRSTTFRFDLQLI